MRIRRPLPAGASRLFFLLLLVLAGLVACAREAPEPERNPWLVVGIDGAEWRVLESLWAEDELPHLKTLANSGTRAVLETAYSTSPIIWTTLATGRKPEDHGITGFTVSTDRGEVPVSSGVRRVPALWNMADRAGLRTAVLGWWATWPAEEVAGPVLTDRILRAGDRAFSPASLASRVEAWKEETERDPNAFGGNDASSRRDGIMSLAARDLASEGYDLTLLYYRSVDIESHGSWKYFEPERFGVGPAEQLANRDRLPDAYRAVDAALGEIFQAVPAKTNVLVISDHGFQANRREETRIFVDMNKVLERLGWVTLGSDGKPVVGESRVYSFGTTKSRLPKRLRYSLKGREKFGTVAPEDRARIRAELAEDLARLTYEDGSPVFRVRDAPPQEVQKGTDFFAVVQEQGATRRTFLDGEPAPGMVEDVSRISGTHTPSTHGILVAAGPDVQPGADLSGITIFDVAPTLLYGLGLPVGDDFAGRVREELFTDAYRRNRAVRRIPTWGTMDSWKKAEASPVDQELIQELESLGYL